MALLIVGASSGVAVGQQCARRPLPLGPATVKLLAAAVLAALAMVLLGYAGGGQLGNFGRVGVDQDTFGIAVFLWFAGIGAITVAMAGGISRRPKPVPVAEPQPESEPSVDEPADEAPATPTDADEPPAEDD